MCVGQLLWVETSTSKLHNKSLAHYLHISQREIAKPPVIMLIFLWVTVLTWCEAMTTNGQRIYFILLLLWGMWRHLCNEIYYLIIVDGDSQWWCGRFIYLKCCYNHVAVVWSHLPPLITIGQTWHTESNSERGYRRTYKSWWYRKEWELLFAANLKSVFSQNKNGLASGWLCDGGDGYDCC